MWQESFCDEVIKLLNKVLRLVMPDPDLTEQWSSIYNTFCKVSLLKTFRKYPVKS